MRTTIIIYKRGQGYVADVQAYTGTRVATGARCGLTPHDAATWAARSMLQYGADNRDGGEIMAPPEVLELVPEHLRSVPALSATEAADVDAAWDAEIERRLSQMGRGEVEGLPFEQAMDNLRKHLTDGRSHL